MEGIPLSEIRYPSATAPSTQDPSKTRPNETRAQWLVRYMKTSVADFFGVGDDEKASRRLWEKRRKRYADSVGTLKSAHTNAVYDEVDSASSRRPRHKESVVHMTWRGVKHLAMKKRRERELPKESRSFPSRKLPLATVDRYEPEGTGLDEVDAAIGPQRVREPIDPKTERFYDVPVTSIVRAEDVVDGAGVRHNYEGAGGDDVDGISLAWAGQDETDLNLRKISDKVMEDMRKKHEPGMGLMGRLCSRKKKREYRDMVDDNDDHRPYFTYWVTFVQAVVLIVSVSVYGFAPVGVRTTIFSKVVKMPNLAMQVESIREIDNMWIGPRQADLIHLGAKYSLCMRRDETLIRALALDTAEEATTGCCVRNDGSGCVQTIRNQCSNTLSTFIKWTGSGGATPGPEGRTSGAVCGQDPEFCTSPSSRQPFEWEDDITKWPLCISTDRPNTTKASQEARHMTCEVVGHPCCHGIQGECIITTREHCDLRRGYYHEEAFLCSQVTCLEKICGMVDFANPGYPDQFIRLFTSLFLHGGILHLLITLIYQMSVMRDLEKLTGAIRMAVIYIGSGVAGNLASCIFLPYTVEAGPSGSQFGLLACLLVEIFHAWPMYERPVKAVLTLCIPILILFVVGLLPFIDNYAHLFGFMFGFFISCGVLPYVKFGKSDRRRKIISKVLALGSCVVLFVFLVILFYVLPLTECPGCRYINCIPFTADFCRNMGVTIKRNSTYSKF